MSSKPSSLQSDELVRWSRRLTLRHQQRQRRGHGDNVNRAFGASMEFADRRAYVQGDDLRHIDWGVLARTDSIQIRQYHEDVAPSCTVLLDCNASMTFSQEKWHSACCLAALLTLTAQYTGARVRLLTVGHNLQTNLDLAPHCLTSIEKIFSDKPQEKRSRTSNFPPLRTGDERFFISDGLYPEGGQEIVRKIGLDASHFHFLEILSKKERQPETLGMVRLRDSHGRVRDQRLDLTSIQGYQKRLAQHQAGWDSALRSCQGGGQRYAIEAEKKLVEQIETLTQAGLWHLGDQRG